ncbi:MAG: hypothetical protein HEQ39_09805 [Rhizobacter sp.]
MSQESRIEEARALVVEKRKCTISLIQHHLKIGYNAAAALVEALQAEGTVIYEADGKYTVLLTAEGLAAMPADADAEAQDPDPTTFEHPEYGTEGHAELFMMGRMLDVAKKRFTTLAEPWSKLRESEQASVLRGLHNDMKDVVRDAVKIIAANARVTFRAQVEKVEFKGMDDVKAGLKLVNTPESHALADSAGGYVTVVIEQLDDLLEIPESALQGEPDNKPLFDASTERTPEQALAETFGG